MKILFPKKISAAHVSNTSPDICNMRWHVLAPIIKKVPLFFRNEERLY